MTTRFDFHTRLRHLGVVIKQCAQKCLKRRYHDVRIYVDFIRQASSTKNSNGIYLCDVPSVVVTNTETLT